jgi:hypothetical protein
MKMTIKQRTVKLITHDDGCQDLVIRQVVSRNRTQTDRYAFAELEHCDWGRGWTLTKEDGERYEINLAGESRSCSCMGFEAHDHCKHTDAVAALLAAGKLPPAGGHNPEPTTDPYGDDQDADYFGSLEADHYAEADFAATCCGC